MYEYNNRYMRVQISYEESNQMSFSAWEKITDGVSSVWPAWHHSFLNFIGVGVTLAVGLHRFVMGENGVRESVKNPRVGYARRRIRVRCWCRGDVGGWAPPLEEKLKWW